MGPHAAPSERGREGTIGAVRSWIDRYRIASFLLVTYAFTWSIQAALVAFGMTASWTLSILVGLGGFGPPVGAAVVVWASEGSLRAWLSQFLVCRIGVTWRAAALLLPPAVLAIGSALFVATGGPVEFGTIPFVGIYLFALAWGTVWGGGQEELGWRGFVVSLLQERDSAFVTSLLVGAAWALCHLPLLLNANTTHGGWPLSQ
ncbi:CPBP family glutamic-type intramembrane protease [Halorientalis pallida]|uniref:CAAX prenyl protease 2/Lysostaphin resistance protein A-like domain-containing protein n=1 Tax=Halorientalis pallida TaxID=2479928 RepID=A0A498KYB2_9EURY|nr:CPBP family glutamic-type intramembrane protease [Halorientalis pallida]RXK46754.1 hypothetical protein EAF64_18970 [Halorientalis pallida]